MEMSEGILTNLAEVIGEVSLSSQLTGYIGFAPTGQIHLGYLIPCMKIRDLTLADANVAILIADIHATLDERKTPPELVAARSAYYQRTLTQILWILGADINRIKFVQGSEFQLTPEYNMKVWELASRITISAAKKAGTEVVKQAKDPKLGSAIYPLMQAIDEQFVTQMAFGLPADFELGGLDQRKIFCFSRDNGSTLAYLMNPIISLNQTNKMSASDLNGKINFTDTLEMIERKIKKAFCADGNSDCGLMKLMRCVFFPLQVPITINETAYSHYRQFERDFESGAFRASQLKVLITQLINDLIAPIRDFLLTPSMQELTASAYP
jgi:tyrosyl-tRNA synthetase